jgi:hypothetical protein
MKRKRNIIDTLTIAIALFVCISGCGETVKEETLPLAKDFFYSGEEGSEYIYQIISTDTESPSGITRTSTDTVKRKIGEIDTLRKEGYIVREVGYYERGLDYVVKENYGFDNNDWYQWVKINSSTPLVKYHQLKNPIKVGATFENINLAGYTPITSTIVSNGTEQIVPAGKFICLVVKMSFDTTNANGNTSSYRETNYYSLGNGVVRSEQQSIRFDASKGTTTTTNRIMQLIQVMRK